MKIKENSIILPLPNDEVISSFEEYCRIELPEEYKKFLKVNNGAIPYTNSFNHEGRDYLIERFLCLLESPESDEIYGWYDLEVVLSQIDTRLTDDENLVGANVIPFAALFAGDFVCLDFRENEKPSVSVWFHEESDELKPVTIKVAESFDEFLKMLIE